MDGACTHCYGNSKQILALLPSPGTRSWTRNHRSEPYCTEISLHVCLRKLGLALARPLWKIGRSGQISVKLFIPRLATMQLKAQLKCTTTFSATQADFAVFYTLHITSKKGFYFLAFISSIKLYYNCSLWKIMKKISIHTSVAIALAWSYWIYTLCIVTFWKTRKHHRQGTYRQRNRQQARDIPQATTCRTDLTVYSRVSTAQLRGRQLSFELTVAKRFRWSASFETNRGKNKRPIP